MTTADVVLGGSGMLGHALHTAAINAAAQPVFQLDSRKSFSLLQEDGSAGLYQHACNILDDISVNSSATSEKAGLCVNLHCSAGAIDPSAPADILNGVNAALPEKLYLALCDAIERSPYTELKIRFATFGTVLETCDALVERNQYLRSKRALLDSWRNRPTNSSVTWHHFQLHTLYGGARHQPSMFAGLMEEALRKRQPFEMSPGMQLREYHHVDDIAISIRHCLATRNDTSLPHSMSSGNPITLRELAERVFEHFGVSDLLRIGALPAPQIEVYENMFKRTDRLIATRDPVDGMIDWMERKGIRRQ